jgi:hypothetical protein
MKIHEENALIHKIHYWSSLTFNYFSYIVSCSIFNRSNKILLGGIAIATLIIITAISEIDFDMCVKDTSYSSIIFKYVCVFLLSGIIVYKTYEKTNFRVAIILSSFIVVEILVAFTINYRYIIRNKFKQMLKRHKTK